MSIVLPKISVLMPVFNSARYVQSAVRSVLDQSERDFELVVIDDGSSDGSTELLRTLAVTDSRIRLTTRENRGLIATRNELLTQAHGELLAWMDSDDVAMSDRLASQARVFAQQPELVCLGGGVLEVDDDGWPLHRNAYPTGDTELRASLESSPVCFPATMMRRAAVSQVGGFREVFAMGEDYDLILRLSEVGQLANLTQIVLEYRRYAESTSIRLSQRWPQYRELAQQLAAERRASGQDRLQRGEHVELDFSHAPTNDSGQDRLRIHVQWARQALGNGFRRTAVKHALIAIREHPTAGVPWRTLLRALLGLKPS